MRGRRYVGRSDLALKPTSFYKKLLSQSTSSIIEKPLSMADSTFITVKEAEALFEKIKEYLSDANFRRLHEAVLFAQKAHEGQLRKSGEPYVTHPLRVAEILTQYHVDEDTLVAAILHDVPEDTPCSLHDIEQKFGRKIAYLVDGITKLSKVYYRDDMEQRQIESLKKLFVHSAEDLRVILIKLADRLHNMRTLHFVAKEEKRQRIAKETMEIYIPIAKLLDINEIRTELEDLCFQHLLQNEYEKLEKSLEENIEERNFILDEMTHLTSREFKKAGIDAEIVGRTKTLYSTYQKLKIKKTLANIDDLLAIRIIVPTRKDCYIALGIIHRLFRPRIDYFKDYIAVPKPNGYQSIHTTVFGINSTLMEFQIRTRYMHLEAEYGIAAHYFYKYSSEKELTTIMRQRSTWVQKILDIQKEENDDKGFIKNLKLDIFQDRIFIFTPKGDVIDLPAGASTIDFAYAIHTEIGNHAEKAKINGLEYPLITALKTGDTVCIVTSKKVEVKREWLNYVKTNTAINKIKIELKKFPYEEKLLTGKRLLQKEFDHIGKHYADELTLRSMKLIFRKFHYETLEQVLIAIAEGNLQPKEILFLFYEKIPEQKAGIFRSKSGVSKKGFISRIGLRILGDNSQGQFREILRILHGLKIPVIKYEVDNPWYFKHDRCRITIIVKNYEELAQVFESMERIEGIKKISRTFIRRKIIFYLWSLLTIGVLASHPFLLKFLMTFKQTKSVAFLISSGLSNYISVLLLFGLILYMRKFTKRSFPELQETNLFWLITFILNVLIFVTVALEVIYFNLMLNWVNLFGLTLIVFGFLLIEYIRYKHEHFQ